MSRLTLFAKGNSDVFETLFACPDPNEPWNGINETLRDRGSRTRVRVRHEVFTRSDALLVAQGRAPPGLDALAFQPPFDLASQFSAAVFEGGAGAVLLSIQPDVTVTLARHRASGALFLESGSEDVTSQRRWIRTECDFVPLLTPEQSLANLEGIVARLRRSSDIPILVFNMCTVVPGETVDCYRGAADALSVRIKRFNLMLIELSARTGVLVVDVDRIAARHGADRLTLDGVRLNARGCKLVCQDIVRLLEHVDCVTVDP